MIDDGAPLLLGTACFFTAAELLLSASFSPPIPIWVADGGVFAVQAVVVRPVLVSLWATWRERRLCQCAAGPRLFAVARTGVGRVVRRAASPGSPSP